MMIILVVAGIAILVLWSKIQTLKTAIRLMGEQCDKNFEVLEEKLKEKGIHLN